MSGTTDEPRARNEESDPEARRRRSSLDGAHDAAGAVRDVDEARGPNDDPRADDQARESTGTVPDVGKAQDAPADPRADDEPRDSKDEAGAGDEARGRDDSPRAGLEESSAPRTGARHPLARILFYGGSLLLLTNLIAILAISLMGWITGNADVWSEQLTGEPKAEILLGFHVLFAPLALAWTAFYRRRFDRRDLRSLGFPRARAFSGLFVGIVAGVLATGLMLGVGSLAGVYAIVGRGPSLWQGIPIALALAGFFVGFFLQSATEEMILRGYVQRNLVEWKGSTPSIAWVLLLPSLGFSFLHVANPGFSAIAAVNTFLIGVFFGAVVLGSGHLWSAIGLHAGWNFSLGCLVSVPVSGLRMPGMFEVLDRGTDETAKLFFGGEYGPEGGLATTLLVLMGLSWALPRALDRWRVDRWGWNEFGQ